MTTQEFFEQLEARIRTHDLLCHPFYQAWSAGELTREDLADYARDYYHHVETFPTYLAELGIRLDEGELRRAVLANLCEEKGLDQGASPTAVEHAELWLDFAEGMGAGREICGHLPPPEVAELIGFFHAVASEGTPEEALAAFYAYESQVPRVATAKARGLREIYAASEKTSAYFALHTTADVRHSRVWKQQLRQGLETHPERAERALAAGASAAQALWHALDGIESRRRAKAAA